MERSNSETAIIERLTANKMINKIRYNLKTISNKKPTILKNIISEEGNKSNAMFYKKQLHGTINLAICSNQATHKKQNFAQTFIVKINHYPGIQSFETAIKSSTQSTSFTEQSCTKKMNFPQKIFQLSRTVNPPNS